ncbi:MAG: HPF/RaiA family ribosome-associated protein [Gammaproteobacteria bacterium]|nr:HPF/RaiA family ribosome-associated protein [Gammaproteobacteria bacterium]MDJ0873342.1 HPF/RaiA family ribosome-associated protein [Gammaproteobacteria bacterium]MDJ0890092.1 HPF/RaiA family ribosome-associated protein [Gammaproteobacteria bacterium]
MKRPLEIIFRNMQPSAAVETAFRDRATKLDRFYQQLMACRVTINAPHKHHHKGNLYHVKVDLTVPNGELVASRSAEDNHAHEDVYVAIRDAFEAIRRRVEEHARRRRGHVKAHDTPAYGRVSRLYPEKDYGMIQTDDRRELYSHRNSVLNASFDKLELRTEVRFAEVAGDLGPKASTVTVVGKHHVVG